MLGVDHFLEIHAGEAPGETQIRIIIVATRIIIEDHTTDLIIHFVVADLGIEAGEMAVFTIRTGLETSSITHFLRLLFKIKHTSWSLYQFQ